MYEYLPGIVKELKEYLDDKEETRPLRIILSGGGWNDVSTWALRTERGPYSKELGDDTVMWVWPEDRQTPHEVMRQLLLALYVCGSPAHQKHTQEG